MMGRERRIIVGKPWRIYMAGILIMTILLVGWEPKPVKSEYLWETELVQVVVNKGDTLWYIAKKYGNPSKDVREVVFQIKSINGLSTSNIYPGQIIAVPGR